MLPLSARMRRVCVFCGSSPGARAEYGQQAWQLGRLLAQRDVGLVYGGSTRGLMGIVARAVMAAGGDVIGVMPEHLIEREGASRPVGELRVVHSMHERKALMADLSDAFIALPGGFGTLDELFEIVTWAQLGLHAKPIGLLNVAGYFDPLTALVDHAVVEGFVDADRRALLTTGTEPAALLDGLLSLAVA
jgi:uncharacterized protein (TIGR00730 family)